MANQSILALSNQQIGSHHLLGNMPCSGKKQDHLLEDPICSSSIKNWLQDPTMINLSRRSKVYSPVVSKLKDPGKIITETPKNKLLRIHVSCLAVCLCLTWINIATIKDIDSAPFQIRIWSRVWNQFQATISPPQLSLDQCLYWSQIHRRGVFNHPPTN